MITAINQWNNRTHNFPTNIIPTEIAWLKLSGKSPMDRRVPPLWINIVIESNPPKSTMLAERLGVVFPLMTFHFHDARQELVKLDLGVAVVEEMEDALSVLLLLLLLSWVVVEVVVVEVVVVVVVVVETVIVVVVEVVVVVVLV